MFRHKSTMALLLAVILLLTMYPMDVFSDEAGQPGDILVYNCGSREVTVDWSALDSGITDSAHGENGVYTIQLEDNAFFPYEIQFQYGGKTTVETFDTPDSTVHVGGHVIGVQTNYGSDAISQIGMYVGGEYVAARQEPKRFTNGPGARSLLPLEEINVTVDLRTYTPEELKTVEVSAIIAGVNAGTDQDISSGQTVLWNLDPYGPSETFRPIGNGTADLSVMNSRSITMIVGSGNQLDSGNKRYNVTIQKLSSPSFYLELYAQDERDGRIELDSRNIDSGENTLNVSKIYSLETDFYLGIGTNISRDPYTVKIYRGLFDTAEAAEASPDADITARIYEQKMQDPDIGYRIRFMDVQPFTIICRLNGRLVLHRKFSVVVQREDVQYSDRVSLYGLYSERAGGGRNNIKSYSDSSYDPMLEAETALVTIEPGYPADGQYYAAMNFYHNGRRENSKVTKAVLGLYGSLEAAAGQPDIKSQLFPEDPYEPEAGYLGNFKDGIYFTIFAGQDVYKYCVSAVESPDSDDTFLNISGAAGILREKVYRMRSKDDSGAGQFGYQVLLIDDDTADLSRLKPVFDTFSGIDAYVNGELQVSGESQQDFSSGPVQYTARAENKRDVKNYWVTFRKLNSEAELFVVVDGQKPGEREVFFNGYTDGHHDIFIANTGGTALTGLNVQLRDAQNVKLDDYWKIGGSGNDTLESFGGLTAGTWGQISAEQPNIAKIRLLPDGEGEVKGTLVISSANGGSCTITLKGQAGNPKIISEKIKDAVKYVPYAFLLQTDNKYDWNKVIFSLEDGRLPDGMMLRPSGEVYGVPTETGTFTFTVEAEYSSNQFETSRAELTLTVLQNTDPNVAGEVDGGYEILDYVPRYVPVIQDYLFRSEGNLDEFVDFWVDGEKMVRGTDYELNPGSTAITVRAQTFRRYGNGNHTIAAEFRVDGDKNKSLKRAAQNYTLNTGSGGNHQSNGGGSTGGSGSGGSSGGSSGGGTAGQSGSMLKSGTQKSTANMADGAQNIIPPAIQLRPRLITRMKGIDFLSLEELNRLAVIAQRGGLTPWLNVDTMLAKQNAVDVRIGINPALARQELYLAASTQTGRAEKVRALFRKFFSNEIPVVLSLSQKEDFEQTAEIAVKASSNIQPEELCFYSYDSETNTYRGIEEPSAWMDSNGYLHFQSSFAGDIVVSKGELVKKGSQRWSWANLFSKFRAA